MGPSIHLLFYRRLNISYSCRFSKPGYSSLAIAPITVSWDPLYIKTSFYMNALRRYGHLFFSFQWTEESSGKYHGGHCTSWPKIEPRPSPMHGTSYSHSTTFHTEVPEAEMLVANNTYLAASVFILLVASMCHSRNWVPVHYNSCCQPVIPGIVILLSEQKRKHLKEMKALFLILLLKKHSTWKLHPSYKLAASVSSN